MLSILLLRSTTRNKTPLGNLVQYGRNVAAAQHFQNYASFTLRELLHESSDEAGTLLTRFAKHIAFEVQKCTSATPTTIRYADYFPVSNDKYFKDELYQRTPVEQLPALIIFASTYRSNANPPKFVMVLNELDAMAVENLGKMDEDTILRTLYAFLFLIPNWITRTDFYRSSTRNLVDNFTNTSLKEKFVQVCFYLGLDKKKNSSQNNPQLLQNMLDQYLDQHLPKLTTMDLAVVCSACYKTATPIQNEALNERLIEEVVSMPLDSAHDALLVTFLKIMRFQRIRSDRVCERLGILASSTQVLQQLQARGLVHLFAYFAENLWNRAECTEPLINEFMHRLKRALKVPVNADFLRAKDVGIFLWCCAQLNCLLNNADLKEIENFITQKLRNNEFRFFPDQLVDSSLSLWLLSYKSRHLLEHAVNLKTEPRINLRQQQREQPKVDSRLTVLLTAAAIEEPTWETKLKVNRPYTENAYVPAYLLKGRNDLMNALTIINEDETVQDAKLVCPINGINIPGILAELKEPAGEKVFVELLTDEQSLYFSGEPVAIMRLKIRLLTSLGHKVIVLNQSDLEAKNYRGLKEWALEKVIEPPDEQSVRSI